MYMAKFIFYRQILICTAVDNHYSIYCIFLIFFFLFGHQLLFFFYISRDRLSPWGDSSMEMTGCLYLSGGKIC